MRFCTTSCSRSAPISSGLFWNWSSVSRCSMRSTGVSSSASWSMLARSADCQSWPISASTSRETALNGSCAWLTAVADRVLDPARGIEVLRDRRRQLRVLDRGLLGDLRPRRRRGRDHVRVDREVVQRSVLLLTERPQRIEDPADAERDRAADVLEQDVAPERGLDGDRPPVVAHDAHARGLLGRASGRCSGPCAPSSGRNRRPPAPPTAAATRARRRHSRRRTARRGRTRR